MSEEKRDPIEQEIRNLDRKVIYIMIVGAVVLIAMPVLVTQLNWFLDFSKTETGVIGDTIGGITSPVIGAISALLIYFSFRAQVNANRIIQKQITEQKKDESEKKNHNYQMEIYNHLKELIDNFQYTSFGPPVKVAQGIGFNPVKHSGSTAIHELIKRLLKIPSENKGIAIDLLFFQSNSLMGFNEKNYISFMNVIALFAFLIERIENSISKDYDVLLILTLTQFQFYNRIWSFVENDVNEAINNEQIDKDSLSIIFDLHVVNQKLLRLNSKGNF